MSPRPRRVPLSLRILHLFSRRATVSWMVWGIGMVFFLALAGAADYSLLTFRGKGRAPGVVRSVRSNGTFVMNQEVFAVDYEFAVGTRVFRGRAYTRDARVAAGRQVAVHYDESNPADSRVAGMLRRPLGPLASLAGIWPLIGALLIVRDIRQGRKAIRLLREAMYAIATFQSKVATVFDTEAGQIYSFTYWFAAADGHKHTFQVEVSEPSRVADEAPKQILSDRDDPSRAVLLEDDAAGACFDGAGELIGRPIAAALALVVPVFFVVLNGGILAIVYVLHRG